MRRNTLYEVDYHFGGKQKVYGCIDCGFVYSEGLVADYEAKSLYAQPLALGSGETQADTKRFDEVAALLRLRVKRETSVLDIGCARGGLLEALHRAGMRDLTGVDPSMECAATVRQKGFSAFTSTLPNVVSPLQYGLVTLSHVLEHVESPHDVLMNIRHLMNEDGLLYIEVPDAAVYYRYRVPFLDFNHEHINHYSPMTLKKATAAAGFGLRDYGLREITMPNGSKYPVIWALLGKGPVEKIACFDHDLIAGIHRYILQSRTQLEQMNRRLETQLGDRREIQIWGAGQFLTQILTMTSIRNRRIVRIADRNPDLWGEEVVGCKVVPVAGLAKGSEPIVVASVVLAKSILEDAERMNIRHRLVVPEEALHG